MKKIENRKDVSLLVNKFYVKIRKDELLGPIFNNHIPKEHWPEHLSKLTDFWESNLFGVPKFKGSPARKHVNVDRNLKHTVEQTHFDRWLQLWFETIDELYEGELAEKAKELAGKIAVTQFVIIKNNRPVNIKLD